MYVCQTLVPVTHKLINLFLLIGQVKLSTLHCIWLEFNFLFEYVFFANNLWYHITIYLPFILHLGMVLLTAFTRINIYLL